MAYLPHREDLRGRRAFHSQFRPNVRPLLAKPVTRTGALYARGGTSADPALLREQAARLVTQTTKTGAKRPADRRPRSEASVGRRVLRQGGEGSRGPAGAGHGRAADPGDGVPGVAERHGEGGRPARAGHAGGADPARAAAAPAPGVDNNAKNVVLVAKPVVDQMLKQLKPAGSIKKFLPGAQPGVPAGGAAAVSVADQQLCGAVPDPPAGRGVGADQHPGHVDGPAGDQADPEFDEGLRQPGDP